ncbi:MAG: Ig-like domain-containing protein, partial [Erysipelotrichaceae bacterium]|nr:Ig-like domain-containing protein [Erysipelotrichaceae bacterium]
MNKKYNKQTKIAMAALLTATSLGQGVHTALANDNVVLEDVQKEEQTLDVTLGQESIKVNETTIITVNGAVGTLSYTSSDETIATVDENGTITGVAAGTVEITVTASATDTHNEATKTLTFTVTDTVVDTIDLSGSKVIINEENITYKYGVAQEPSVTVQLGEQVLEKGVDYEVTYENNEYAGEAKVIITGIGKYTGTAIQTFTIHKAQALFKISVSFDGSKTKVYDGEPMRISGASITSDAHEATYTYYKKEGSEWVVFGEPGKPSQMPEGPIEVGVYKIVGVLPETNNYTGVTAEEEFMIINPVDAIPAEGGVITNPDNSTIDVNAGEEVHSNGSVIVNEDGSITFPEGGAVFKEGSVETIQKGAVFGKANGVATNSPQTGDASKAGLWASLVSLSAGLIYL